MFHRLPFILATAAAIAVVAFLFSAVSPSFTSPGTAHASHSGMPEVRIASITPVVGEEGRNVTVTLKLSRPLTEDEEYCYPGKSADEEPRNEVCIQGGIFVMDSYNDHLPRNGASISDHMIAFVFKRGKTEDRLRVPVDDDKCITPGRMIRITMNPQFPPDDYGYNVDTTDHWVRIAGDDETNGELFDDKDNDNPNDDTGKCLPIDDGATEDIPLNSAPAFGKQPITFSIQEDAESGEDIGAPVTATDPDEDDDLTYSLTGTDAAPFDIDPSTGQIKTKDPLDHETKDTYHLAVSVTDSKDIDGDSDMTEDDSIDVTINVTNVNEAPEFDPNAPTDLNVMENTAADVDIGTPITAIDPDNGDTVTYDLDNDDGASFEIDETTGQIKTKDPLDKETQETYTVTVTASDAKVKKPPTT